MSGSWASSGIGIRTCLASSTRSSVRSRAPPMPGRSNARTSKRRATTLRARLERSLLLRREVGEGGISGLLKGNESGGHSWLRSGRPRYCRRPVVGCRVKAPPAGEGGHHLASRSGTPAAAGTPPGSPTLGWYTCGTPWMSRGPGSPATSWAGYQGQRLGTATCCSVPRPPGPASHPTPLRSSGAPVFDRVEQLSQALNALLTSPRRAG